MKKLMISGRKPGGYFLTYTVLFCLMCIIVYMTFIVNGKSFIWWTDGKDLHWLTLVYYGKWLRSAARNLISGLPVPEYDFSIGYGSPIISTLHWDVIGDPLNLLSVFFNEQNTEFLLGMLVIIRLYLAGTAFSLYCLHRGRNKLGTLAGTFSYIFSGYSLFTCARHPHFLNPMILLPFLMMAADRAIDRGKRGAFAFTVCISVLTSFYFSYMLGIFIVAYYFFRFFAMESGRNLKSFFGGLLRMLVPGIIGIMMACVILVPVVTLYMGGLRVNSTLKYAPLYSLKYYKKLIGGLLAAKGAGNWTWTGISVSSFVAGLALLGKKVSGNIHTKNEVTALRTALIISFAAFFVPAAGSALNGFNYVSNRWEWCFAFVASYCLASMWPDLFALDRRQKRTVLFGTVIYEALLYIFMSDIYKNAFAVAALLAAASALVLAASAPETVISANRWFKKHYTLLPSCLVILTLVHLCVNAHSFYDGSSDGYVGRFENKGEVYVKYSDSAAHAADMAAAEKKDGNGIIRYEYRDYDDKQPDTGTIPNPPLLYNADMLAGTYGTQFYFSLANGYISQYLLDMDMDSWVSYSYTGLKGRTFLDTLAGVKYFIYSDGSDSYIPYGYDGGTNYTVGLSQEKYTVLTNKYALPLGYTYSSYFTHDEYDGMTGCQRQEAMLEGVLLEDDGANAVHDSAAQSSVSENGDSDGTGVQTHGITKTDLSYTSRSVDYSVNCDENVKQLSDGSFLVGEAGACVTVKFEGLPDSETYLYIKGLDCRRMTQKQLYLDGDDDIKPYSEYLSMSAADRNAVDRDDFYASSWDNDSKIFDITATCGNVNRTITYRTPYHLYYIGQKNFLSNFGYSEKGEKNIKITFPTPGRYSFDEMRVICQPMSGYAQKVQALARNTFEDEKHEINAVSGTVNLDSDRILVLTIPYDKGWTAYVDGKKVPVYRANVMDSALILSAGHHDIKFKYSTPGLISGGIITLAGAAAFIIMLIAQEAAAQKARRR